MLRRAKQQGSNFAEQKITLWDWMSGIIIIALLPMQFVFSSKTI